MGRFKPGWSLDQVKAHLEAISPGLFEATLPPTYQPDTAKLYLAYKLTAEPSTTGVSSLRARYENPLWLLMATAGLALLLPSPKPATPLLARATPRERD